EVGGFHFYCRYSFYDPRVVYQDVDRPHFFFDERDVPAGLRIIGDVKDITMRLMAVVLVLEKCICHFFRGSSRTNELRTCLTKSFGHGHPQSVGSTGDLCAFPVEVEKVLHLSPSGVTISISP